MEEGKYLFDNGKKELATSGECFPITPGGIGKVLFDKMRKHAENGLIAQIEVETGVVESYSDFLNRSIRLALYLNDEGIKPGDVISMCSHNNMNNSVVLVASQFIGAIIASTDPIMSLDDTTSLLRLVEPKIVFASRGCEDTIQKALAQSDNHQCNIVVFHDHPSYVNLSVILEKYTENDVQAFEPFYVEDSKTTSCILFTSGTTGMPKGSCVSHNYQEAHILKFLDQPGQVIQGYASLYWGTAVFFTIQQLHFGLTKVNCTHFDSQSVWATMDKYKVNVCYLSYYHCMQALKTLNGPVPNLKSFFIVGGQLADNYYREYENKLPDTCLIATYGSTECMAVSLRQPVYQIGSAGRPIHKGQTIKIVDPDTEQPLELNEVGEIQVKCEHQMTGYYKMDSDHVWGTQGFFKTGDLGYLDHEFNLFVVDRIKDMFKYCGWHVIPAKIEKALLSHSDVLHAVVVGVPEADCGNLAMGVVVLKKHLTSCTVTGTCDELVDFVNDKMDDMHQIRAGIKIIQEWEMVFSTNGKINRRKMRELFV